MVKEAGTSSLLSMGWESVQVCKRPLKRSLRRTLSQLNTPPRRKSTPPHVGSCDLSEAEE